MSNQQGGRTPSEAGTPQPTGCLPILTRIVWMGAGFVPLIFLVVALARGRGFALGTLDLAFWLFVAGLLLARWVDLLVFHGDNARNAPSTRRDAWVFTAWSVLATGSAWTVAHWIASLRG